MASVTWEGYDVLRLGLQTIADPPMEPLMEQWERIIVEGNRRGVLQGIDGFDQPMPPLRYRNGIGIRARNRKSSYFGTKKYKVNIGTGANLTTREYQKLTGPRLAPRGERSRVIANLRTQHGRDPSMNYAWFAEGAWLDVVSITGYPFLEAHFDPQAGSRLPRYDLRPVRPDDMRLAEAALTDYMEDLIKRLF